MIAHSSLNHSESFFRIPDPPLSQLKPRKIGTSFCEEIGKPNQIVYSSC